MRRLPHTLFALLAALAAGAPLPAAGAALLPPAGISVPAECTVETCTVGWLPSPSASVAYQVQEATDAAFTRGVNTAYRGRKRSLRVGGGTNGQRYYYRVRAVRAGVAPSRWVRGAAGCLMSRAPALPGVPTVSVTGDEGTCRVRWAPSPTPETAYELEIATAADFSAGLRRAYSGDYNWAATTGGAEGTTYHFRVRATRAAWYPSAWVAGTNGCAVPERDTTPPAPVSGLAALAGTGRVDLAWENPGDADLAGVRVVRRRDREPSGPDDGETVCDGPAAGCADLELDAGDYRYAAFAHDAVPNYAAGAAAGATVLVGHPCEGCHAGNPARPLAPNVVDGPLPGGDATLRYNWYGRDALRQDGGHGDPQGLDKPSASGGLGPPQCTDCHDVAAPPGGHRDGTLQSPFGDAPRSANTSHLKPAFFDAARVSPPPARAPGAWSVQVAFDNYCAYQCHTDQARWVTQRRPDMRHQNDTTATSPNWWSVELGTHLTKADGEALAEGYLFDAALSTDAAGAPDYAPCVSCHDPHGTTTRPETTRPSNRMLRDTFIDPPNLCGGCHI